MTDGDLRAYSGSSRRHVISGQRTALWHTVASIADALPFYRQPSRMVLYEPDKNRSAIRQMKRTAQY